MSTAENTPRRPGDVTQTAAELQLEWDADPRWEGIRRDYTAADVVALRGTVRRNARSPAAAPRSCGSSSTSPAPPTTRSGSRPSVRSPATRPCSRCVPV